MGRQDIPLYYHFDANLTKKMSAKDLILGFLYKVINQFLLTKYQIGIFQLTFLFSLI